MIRRLLFPAASDPRIDPRDGFVHRGESPSRIECFSDCIFAFALTLLVVSLEVPKTFDALKATLPGFVGFALSFAVLMLLWNRHALFFRRYGLQDRTTTVLNSVLMFLLLFYVYPLRFLSTLTVAVYSAIASGGEPRVNLPDGTSVKPMSISAMPELMLLYFAGWGAIFAVFTWMHVHAYRQRARLELSAYEELATRSGIELCAVTAVAAALGVVMCTLGMEVARFAPLLMLGAASVRRRQRKRLETHRAALGQSA